MKLLIFSLIISICAFSQSHDDLREIQFNKKVQERISKELVRLSNVDFSQIQLETYIFEVKSKCIESALTRTIDKALFLEKCEEQFYDYMAFGDLETIVDMQIAELSELQTSFFQITLFSGFASRGDKAQFYALLPLTLALDIIFLPYYIFAGFFGF